MGAYYVQIMVVRVHPFNLLSGSGQVGNEIATAVRRCYFNFNTNRTGF
jgi:hypothetical protein